MSLLRGSDLAELYELGDVGADLVGPAGKVGRSGDCGDDRRAIRVPRPPTLQSERRGRRTDDVIGESQTVADEASELSGHVHASEVVSGPVELFEPARRPETDGGDVGRLQEGTCRRCDVARTSNDLAHRLS